MVELTIEYDPREHAAESNLVLNEDHYILPDCSFIEWLRRELNDPKLFVYWHRRTGNFVLCQWLYPPVETTNPVAQELEVFKTDPRLGWPTDLMAPEVLRARLAPIDEIMSARRRADRDASYRRDRDKAERQEVRRKAASRLRKMGLEREARSVESGEVPMAPVRNRESFLETV